MKFVHVVSAGLYCLALSGPCLTMFCKQFFGASICFSFSMQFIKEPPATWMLGRWVWSDCRRSAWRMAIEVGFKASFRRLTDALILITDIALIIVWIKLQPHSICAQTSKLWREDGWVSISQIECIQHACTRSTHDLQVVSYNQTWYHVR